MTHLEALAAIVMPFLALAVAGLWRWAATMQRKGWELEARLQRLEELSVLRTNGRRDEAVN